MMFNLFIYCFINQIYKTIVGKELFIILNNGAKIIIAKNRYNFGLIVKIYFNSGPAGHGTIKKCTGCTSF